MSKNKWVWLNHFMYTRVHKTLALPKMEQHVSSVIRRRVAVATAMVHLKGWSRER